MGSGIAHKADLTAIRGEEITMFRNYEDPYRLEQLLTEAKARLIGADPYEAADIYEEIADLKDRINFAWQDDEYDHDNMDYADEMWMYENCY